MIIYLYFINIEKQINIGYDFAIFMQHMKQELIKLIQSFETELYFRYRREA